MKIYTLIIGLLLFYTSVISQTKVDQHISIEIPGTVQKMDTITNDASVSSFYSNSEAESYVVIRIALLADGNEVNTLPTDSILLNKFYSKIINPQVESMGKKGFLLKSTQKIKIEKYIAYKITYKTEDSESEGAETLVLCLNGVVYVFTYSKVGNYIEQHKDQFQKSLKVNGLAKQIADTPVTAADTSLTNVIIYGIVALVLLVFFIRKTRDRSNLGINLNRVYCPSCQTKQPIIRKPANQRQMLWGGYTCNKCKTEMDKYGVAVPLEE